MCDVGFKFTLIGEDKLIMCRQEDFAEAVIFKAISKAFPELIKQIAWWKRWLVNSLQRLQLISPVHVRAERIPKQISSLFGVKLGPLMKENDWGKNPIIALWIFEKGGVTFCDAKIVSVN